MQLDREWADVRAALQWADSTGSTLIRKAHSVDGALALVRAWRTAQNGDARPKAATRARRSGPTEREVAHLKKMLNAAARYIAVVEEELAACTGTPNGKRSGMDAADRSKVQKVAKLWLRPGTDGEGSAAAHKLRALSCRLGWPIRDLLHACQIEGPADWTFTSTL
jgi:hypothetical protein